MRIAWLLAVVATAGLSACSGPADGTHGTKSSPIVRSGCADVIVLGARGSIQDPDANDGVGGEVKATAEQLARHLHDTQGWTTRIVAVRYDASASATQELYVQHVADGAEQLAARLTKLQGTCPDARFALIGFSQGAQVVHAAALDLPDKLAGSVAAVAMIADPRRNPDDRIAQWTYDGAAAPRPGRLGAGTPIPANLRAVSISFCTSGDEICNAAGSPGQAPSKTHREFYEQPSAAKSTADQLTSLITGNGNRNGKSPRP